MIPTYTCGCLKALKIMDLCVGWISAKPINPENKKCPDIAGIKAIHAETSSTNPQISTWKKHI